jgi:hypothetical protein
MLSALAHAIHDDVRNNNYQELNLSSHPLTLAAQRTSDKKIAPAVRSAVGRSGKVMSGHLQQHPNRR